MSRTAMFGGLLAGLGKGMVAEAEQRRQDALERARQMAREREREEDRAFTLERDAETERRTRERDAEQHTRAMEREDRTEQRAMERENRQGGLIRSTVTGEDGNLYGIPGTGPARDLGVRPMRQSSDGEFSPADKRLWDTVRARHTTKGLEGEQTDWDAMAREFGERGRPDMARLAVPDPSSRRVNVDSPEYREAERRADAWIRSQAGWFSRDSSDFREFGGNREQARQAKIMEFYGQMTGRGGQPAPGDQPAPDGEQVQDGQAASQPAGRGTRQDPYKATTQAHIDWFRENAADGAVIEVNGQLFTK